MERSKIEERAFSGSAIVRDGQEEGMKLYIKDLH